MKRSVRSLLLALRAFDHDPKTERFFEYEPTYSTIGTGRQQPFCILKQRPCILAKTFGSRLGSYSATADCWLWLHRAWLRETVQGPEAFAAILHMMGVPAPHLMAWLTILTELIGGFAVLLGAFVPLASLPMAAVLLVAMLTVHLPYGFSSIKLLSVTSGRAQFGPPGYELDLLYLACLAALVFGGSGPLAIDRHLRKKC
jgi:putative oxidoreductase